MFKRYTTADLCRMNPERICLIKPSALGDVVQTIPLLPAIKRRFPEAKISWVINQELSGLIEGHPDLDEAICFDRRAQISKWFELLRMLRSRRFDMVLDLQGLLRSAVMVAATGAPVRVGLQTAREGAGAVVNCEIPNSSRNVPAHARNWRVAEVLEMGDLPRQVLITTSGEDRAWAMKTVAGLPRPILAFHPGAKWITKRWPVEKFTSLIERAQSTWQGTVLLIGSPSEHATTEQIRQDLIRQQGPEIENRIINLAGQST